MTLDPDYAQSVLDNPMIQIKKSGVIWKKSEGMFNQWEERFLVLTNCGLLYFKKGSEQPQKFKLLNNFLIEGLSNQECKTHKKDYILKIKFNKNHVKKD